MTEEEIIKEYPILYKYIDFEGALEMLRNQTIKFCDIRSLNDSYESYYYNVDLKPFLFNLSSGICSLSETPDNFSLWSYYNGHTGLCIGLNTAELMKFLHEKLKNITLIKVEYKEIQDLKPKQLKNTSKDQFLFYSSKPSLYEHEREVRIIFDGTNKDNPIRFPFYSNILFNTFEEIYFGANFFKNNKFFAWEKEEMIIYRANTQTVSENFSVSNKKPKFYKMKLKDDEYGVIREEYEPPSYKSFREHKDHL